MGASEIPAAIATRDLEVIRAAIVKDLVPVIPATTDPQTWDPRELGDLGGNVWKAVLWQERLWHRDDESTADHDEVTCIVLLDGGHYLTNDVKFPGSVLSRTVETPPDPDGSPSVSFGDAYRVPAGATDAWAGHENEVTLYTARGWKFKPPAIGDLHYVQSEELYEHFGMADAWVDGIPLGFEVGSIPPSALIWDGRVENQTTNSPPVSWSKGEAYIVGTSASGDWSGHAGKIALALSDGVLADGDEFDIRTPFVGQLVYDKAIASDVRWNGTAWVSAAGSWVEVASLFTAGTGSTTGPSGLSAYVYSNNTAPTTASRHLLDDASITHAARSMGTRKLRLRYSADVTLAVLDNTKAGNFVIALKRDSETTYIDWVRPHLPESLFANTVTFRVSVEFLIDAVSTSASTYKVALLCKEQGWSDYNSVERRLFTLEEKG